jgi:large subunit ribosomal protein L13
MKTYSARPADIDRRWLVIDAEGRTLGRLATEVATLLRGKHKPIYTPHIDTGDHVVVINASDMKLSGTKLEEKQYFRHTQYPGGVKWTALKAMMEEHPDRVVVQAVRGMLPKTKLGRAMIKKLKVYAGSDHPHTAQQPVAWEGVAVSREEAE